MAGRPEERVTEGSEVARAPRVRHTRSMISRVEGIEGLGEVSNNLTRQAPVRVAEDAVSPPEASVGDAVSAEAASRTRRELTIGRLMCAAGPTLLAAHASIAAAHASIEAELASMRSVAPLHPGARTCVALLQEAEASSHEAWEAVSALACLSDEVSRRCEPSRVLTSVASLMTPYLASRATVEALATQRLPAVRVAPAVLAEALVVFATRVAQQFPERAGAHITMVGVETERGVEIEVRATHPMGPIESRHDRDAAVGEIYGRELGARCGGHVEVLRDAAGATRFRAVMPRA